MVSHTSSCLFPNLGRVIIMTRSRLLRHINFGRWSFCWLQLQITAKRWALGYRNSASVPDSGFFGPECSDWGFAAPTVFHWHTFTYRPISTAPPLRTSLIPSERTYQSFLSLRTSKRSHYRDSFSWVAFKLKKKRPKPRPLRRNFGSRSGSDPIPTHERPEPWPEFAT